MQPIIEEFSFHQNRIFKFYTFDLQLKEPLVLTGPYGKAVIQSKQALYITLDGQSLHCELSPLPCFHKINFKDSKQELISFLESIKTQDIRNIDTKGFKEIVKKLSTPVKSCLSQIYYQMNHNISYNQFKIARKGIQSNKLLTSLDDTPHISLSDSKYIKVKINRIPIEQEKNQLKEILKRYPDHLFRLDANQSFSPEELQDYLVPIEYYKKQIDYIEEPFQTIDEYNQFNDPWPIALDENAPYWRNIKSKNLQALVIKPSLFGTLFDVLELLESGSPRIIISSAFDGPVGQDWNAFLASKVNRMTSYNEYHGLNTDEFFHFQDITLS